jgi:hypothetical protein
MGTMRSAQRTLLLSQGGVVLAAMLLVAAVFRGGEPLAVTTLGADAVAGASSGPTANSRSGIDLSRLVDGDPFSPVRAAPEVRYRIGAVEAVVARAPALPPVRLLGTIVRPTGRSFAMCQVGEGPARVVYPGDRIGALRLESVSQGSAEFIDDEGARVVLRVPGNGRSR